MYNGKFIVNGTEVDIKLPSSNVFHQCEDVYKPISEVLNDVNDDLSQLNSRLSESINDIKENGNVFDGSIKSSKLEGVSYAENMIDGTYQDNKGFDSSGNIVDSTDSVIWNSHIPLKVGDTLYRLNLKSSSIVLYDSNGNMVSWGRIGLSTTDEFYTVSSRYSSCAYAMVSDGKNNMIGQVWSVNSKPEDIIPYGQRKYNFTNNPLYSQIINRIPSAGKIPMITLVDDDTFFNYIERVKTVCDDLGIKCTFACVTSRLSNADLVQRLKDYQAEGYDIVSHSHTHDRWYKTTSDGQIFTSQECEEDLILSLKTLNEKGFITTNGLIIPGSPFGISGHEDLINRCSKWVDYLDKRSTGVNRYDESRYNMSRKFIEKTNEIETYYSMIDDCIANKDWIIFATHSSDNGSFDSNYVKNVMQYAKTKDVKIVTLSEGYRIRESMYKYYEMFN